MYNLNSCPHSLIIPTCLHVTTQSDSGCGNLTQHLLVCLNGGKCVNSRILITIPTRCCSNSAMTTDTTGVYILHILPSKVMVEIAVLILLQAVSPPPTDTCVHMNSWTSAGSSLASSLPTTHKGNQWTLSLLLPSWNTRLLWWMTKSGAAIHTVTTCMNISWDNSLYPMLCGGNRFGFNRQIC